VQKQKCNCPLCILFDSGSDTTLINQSALPKGAVAHIIAGGHKVNGIHGSAHLNQDVLMTGLCFPEFSPTQKIPGPIWATVFDNNESNYNIIIGMDLMSLLGIDINCSTKPPCLAR